MKHYFECMSIINSTNKRPKQLCKNIVFIASPFIAEHLLRVQIIDNVPIQSLFFFCFYFFCQSFLYLTCVSDRLSCLASSVRSRPTTYWHRWNSSSSRYSCSAVNEVRVRLGRSKSRPFGSTISRMVPLASGRKNTTRTKTQRCH